MVCLDWNFLLQIICFALPYRFYVTRTVAQHSSNNPQALFPPSFRKIVSRFVHISYVTTLKKVSSLTWAYFYVKFGIKRQKSHIIFPNVDLQNFTSQLKNMLQQLPFYIFHHLHCVRLPVALSAALPQTVLKTNKRADVGF